MQATPEMWRLMIEGLFTTVTNVNFNENTIRELIGWVHAEKARLAPDCAGCAAPCGRTSDYDMNLLWSADEDIRSLKSLILFGVRGMAAYAHHALVLGYTDDEVNRFFAKALFAIGEDWGVEELLPIVMEVGEKNLKCMALLDKANTESYGTPVPVTVPLTVEKGPFVVISGHDLHDLKLLLEQTEGKGINIYTHGEMLPAHGYPELKSIPISRAISARHGKPAERVCRTSCAGAVHHQLSDAAQSKLCRPGVHHVGGILPRNDAHRSRQGLRPGDRKGFGVGRLFRG